MTFDQWLKTEKGEVASDYNSLLRSGQTKYLVGRLYWAYQAGLDQKSIEVRIAATESEIRRAKLEFENRRLRREINALKKVLKD